MLHYDNLIFQIERRHSLVKLTAILGEFWGMRGLNANGRSNADRFLVLGNLLGLRWRNSGKKPCRSSVAGSRFRWWSAITHLSPAHLANAIESIVGRKGPNGEKTTKRGTAKLGPAKRGVR